MRNNYNWALSFQTFSRNNFVIWPLASVTLAPSILIKPSDIPYIAGTNSCITRQELWQPLSRFYTALAANVNEVLLVDTTKILKVGSL